MKKKEYDCPGGLPVVENCYLVMYEGGLRPGQITEVKNGQTVKGKCFCKADSPKGCT